MERAEAFKLLICTIGKKPSCCKKPKPNAQPHTKTHHLIVFLSLCYTLHYKVITGKDFCSIHKDTGINLIEGLFAVSEQAVPQTRAACAIQYRFCFRQVAGGPLPSHQ